MKQAMKLRANKSLLMVYEKTHILARYMKTINPILQMENLEPGTKPSNGSLQRQTDIILLQTEGMPHKRSNQSKVTRFIRVYRAFEDSMNVFSQLDPRG